MMSMMTAPVLPGDDGVDDRPSDGQGLVPGAKRERKRERVCQRRSERRRLSPADRAAVISIYIALVYIFPVTTSAQIIGIMIKVPQALFVI